MLRELTVQNVRDKADIRLDTATAAELAKRPIEYDTGFTLLPGTYTIKFLARDAETGRIGTYQAPGALLKLLGPLCVEGGRRRTLGDFAAAAQPIWAQIEPGLLRLCRWFGGVVHRLSYHTASSRKPRKARPPARESHHFGRGGRLTSDPIRAR